MIAAGIFTSRMPAHTPSREKRSGSGPTALRPLHEGPAGGTSGSEHESCESRVLRSDLRPLHENPCERNRHHDGRGGTRLASNAAGELISLRPRLEPKTAPNTIRDGTTWHTVKGVRPGGYQKKTRETSVFHASEGSIQRRPRVVKQGGLRGDRPLRPKSRPGSIRRGNPRFFRRRPAVSAEPEDSSRFPRAFRPIQKTRPSGGLPDAGPTPWRSEGEPCR